MTTHPPHNTIDDELLSSFLDGQVTPDERRRVEAALAADAGLAGSLGTVKSRLSRARAKLRDFLLEQQELLPKRYRLEADD